MTMSISHALHVQRTIHVRITKIYEIWIKIIIGFRRH